MVEPNTRKRGGMFDEGMVMDVRGRGADYGNF